MKGQAFEVFRLLIAAVVAGAILMVLLGLLQGLITPTTDPQTAAAQLVKKYSTYGGVGSTDLIDFRKGMAIDARAIAREAYLDLGCVGVKADIDGFDCSSTQGVCEYTKPVGTKARIKVNCGTNVQVENSAGNSCPEDSMKCQITITR